MEKYKKIEEHYKNLTKIFSSIYLCYSDLRDIKIIKYHNLSKKVMIYKRSCMGNTLQNKELMKKQDENQYLLDIYIKNIKDFLSDKKLTLYFDNSLNNETDFLNKLNELENNSALFRIQYISFNKSYKVTIYINNEQHEVNELDFELLTELINRLEFNEIILNNLVDYPDKKAIKTLITNYKKFFLQQKSLMKLVLKLLKIILANNDVARGIV